MRPPPAASPPAPLPAPVTLAPQPHDQRTHTPRLLPPLPPAQHAEGHMEAVEGGAQHGGCAAPAAARVAAAAAAAAAADARSIMRNHRAPVQHLSAKSKRTNTCSSNTTRT